MRENIYFLYNFSKWRWSTYLSWLSVFYILLLLNIYIEFSGRSATFTKTPNTSCHHFQLLVFSALIRCIYALYFTVWIAEKIKDICPRIILLTGLRLKLINKKNSFFFFFKIILFLKNNSNKSYSTLNIIHFSVFNTQYCFILLLCKF